MKSVKISHSTKLNCKKILCVAEAFGFGPASKLYILLTRFSLNHYIETTFLGNGCAYELCQSGPFHRIIKGDHTRIEHDTALQKIMSQHQILITAMEFSPLATARKFGLKTVVLDSLFWMWPATPCRLEDVDLYVCQNFLGVRERCQAVSQTKFLLVPPLTFAQAEGERSQNLVILNFGGMDNPFAERSKLLAYAQCMYSIVSKICARLGYRLEVYGRRPILEELKTQFNYNGEIVKSLPLKLFVERLGQAKFLITSPGLETLYEAFTLKIPVFLLPPQNNSQAYQAQGLQQEIPLLPGPQYDILLEIPKFTRNNEPGMAIQEILESVLMLQKNPQAIKQLSQALEHFLGANESFLNELRETEYNFIERMKDSADCMDISTLHERLWNV